MILALHTATPTCFISVHDGAVWHEYEWESGRSLALNLLSYIQEATLGDDKSWKDISGIIVFEGPGSFTGLRIGLTVMNTLAQSLNVPIIGTTGDDWKQAGLARLTAGENDRVVMPLYGSAPHITTPRK